MNESVRLEVLRGYCQELKMPRIVREYEAATRQANNDQWEYPEYLLHLLDMEIQGRRDSAVGRRIRQANFPDLKTLDQIDWKVLAGVSRPKIMELAGCQYLDSGADVVLAGPIGTGKTMLATALGVEAAKRRKRVLFQRAAELVRTLIEARDERSLGRLHKRYQGVDLLIIDELGFVPFDRAGGELLFNLLSDRYERRSTIITTNLNFGEWAQVFGDEKLTTALLDRIAHHAEILTTKGDSYRTRNRNRGGKK